LPGGNVIWNLDEEQVKIVTLTDNKILNAPLNMQAGATYTLIIKQDGVGNRTLDFSNSTYLFPGGTEPVLSVGVNDIDVITFVCDGTNMLGTAQNNFS